MTAKPIPLPMMTPLKEGLGGFNAQIFNMIPLHDWPYWKPVLICAGVLILLMTIGWFYDNFWR
jgi:Mg2+ and Co2+ transporter CorA